jgi:LysM repeat protein
MSRMFFSGGLRRTGLVMALVFALVLAALPAALFAAPVSSDYGHGCGGNCYVVKAGDTLSQIAKYFGVNYHDLARMNGISDPSLIYVGQVLRIPHGGGYYPGHDKKDDCGGCDHYKKDDRKGHDCYDCGYHKDDDKGHDCYDCGYHKDDHKDDCHDCDYHKKDDKHGCGGCGYSYDSYSGYLYGSHYESSVVIDEYNYGYSYSSSDYHKSKK